MATDIDAPARAVAAIDFPWCDWDDLSREQQNKCRDMADAAIDTHTAAVPAVDEVRS